MCPTASAWVISCLLGGGFELRCVLGSGALLNLLVLLFPWQRWVVCWELSSSLAGKSHEDCQTSSDQSWLLHVPGSSEAGTGKEALENASSQTWGSFSSDGSMPEAFRTLPCAFLPCSASWAASKMWMHIRISAVQSPVEQDLPGFPSVSPLTVLIGCRHHLPPHCGKAVMQGWGCFCVAAAPLMLPGVLTRFSALQLMTDFSKADTVRSIFVVWSQLGPSFLCWSSLSFPSGKLKAFHNFCSLLER